MLNESAIWKASLIGALLATGGATRAADTAASSPASKPATTAAAHAGRVAATAPAKPAADATKSPAASSPAHYEPDRFAGRAGKYYQAFWGIDSITVKLVESGELVRFSYRVLDPDKAGPLNDKRNEASLIDARAGVSLVVPTMEKVGQLRQGVQPVAGRSYWMAFSNKSRPVRRGDRVDIQVGPFRANNLVVD